MVVDEQKLQRSHDQLISDAESQFPSNRKWLMLWGFVPLGLGSIISHDMELPTVSIHDDSSPWTRLTPRMYIFDKGAAQNYVWTTGWKGMEMTLRRVEERNDSNFLNLCHPSPCLLLVLLSVLCKYVQSRYSKETKYINIYCQVFKKKVFIHSRTNKALSCSVAQLGLCCWY